MPTEGQQVGPYELTRKLGAGAFGEVWLVRHRHLGAERAMKIPTDPAYVKQLRLEGKLQFELDHPNIVHTFDLDPDHNPPYFVMEYVEGESLRTRLDREGKLPLGEALAILEQILEAIQAAHANGVLHRDLKPENILLAPDGTAKVTDFGLGKVQAEVAQSLLLSGSMKTVEGRSISGTYAYMSPEQQAGEEPTPGDDLYALGVVSCELLIGTRPRPGVAIEDMFEDAGLDDSLSGMVKKALAMPRRRYQSAREMGEAVAGAEMLRRARDEERSHADAQARIERERRDADHARRGEQEHRTNPEVTNSIGIKLRLIQPGTFLMGSERGDLDEKPAQRVTIEKPFYLGVYEITQAQYETVMGTNPSLFKGPNRPVETVSWDDAQAFCRRLSEREGVEYRLPTEAEWEYACRAGSATEYSFGNSKAHLGDYAWFDANGGKTTHDAGLKKPNAWGLYDMHGNVWEWCASPYAGLFDGSEQKGADAPGEMRVLRGASVVSSAGDCRSASRIRYEPDYVGLNIGFRLSRGL